MDFILHDSRWLAANLHSGTEAQRHESVQRLFNVHLHPRCHGEAQSLPEIKALVLPDVLHYPNDLQRQHVLPQICGGTGRDEEEVGVSQVNISCSLINRPSIMEQSCQRQSALAAAARATPIM